MELCVELHYDGAEVDFTYLYHDDVFTDFVTAREAADQCYVAVRSTGIGAMVIPPARDIKGKYRTYDREKFAVVVVDVEDIGSTQPLYVRGYARAVRDVVRDEARRMIKYVDSTRGPWGGDTFTGVAAALRKVGAL